MIRSVLLVSRDQNENIFIAIVWGDGRPTRVSTAGHQNKVAFLNALREELNMPKPKKSKSKPKGVQFRRAAKKRESVKGVLVIYIYLTIFDILIIRYLLSHYSLGKKKNRNRSALRTTKGGHFLDGLRDNLGLSKSKVLNRAMKFGNSSQETKTVKGMMGI